jgi:serine/threonine protein phosphatase PrpC
MKTVIEAAAKTDVGLVRTNNEDNFGYDLQTGIFVVCDGMGGHAAGETASRIAVGAVVDHFGNRRRHGEAKVFGRSIHEVSRRANNLANAIHLANQAIRDSSSQNPQWSGMGSTIVAVLSEGNQFSIGHVGDSRAYLVRDGAVHQLTTDHSLVMEQVRRGLITMDEAEHSKMQNVIVRALGAEESVEPDLEDHEFVPRDVLLLCSDGLSRYVKDESMVEVIGRTGSLDAACDELIALAKTGGSDDNITCLLVRASEQSWQGRLRERLSSGNSGEVHYSWS